MKQFLYSACGAIHNKYFKMFLLKFVFVMIFTFIILHLWEIEVN